MAKFDLSRVAFFDDFSSVDLSRVHEMAEEVSADAGAVLMRQGDVGQEAFVIVSGQAEVLVADHRVATLSAGSMVGEMALLDRRPRSATVRALTDMDLLRFDSARFQALLETMPKAAARIMADLGDKLRAQNLGQG